MQTSTRKKSAIRRCFDRLAGLYDRQPVLFPAVLAVLLALVLEMLGRHSPLKGLAFLFCHPVNFLVNALIILTTLAVCRLFKRRNYFLTLVSSLWLLLGVANAVVLCFRSTPLGAVDLAILPSAISIIDVYIDKWLIIALCVLLAAGLGAETTGWAS